MIQARVYQRRFEFAYMGASCKSVTGNLLIEFFKGAKFDSPPFGYRHYE